MDCSKFLPEGSLIKTDENMRLTSSIELLEYARKNNIIIEAIVSQCDPEHNLIVELNGLKGIIAHNDTATGIEEGSIKEIAIISKVGKPIVFTICGSEITHATTALKLSRRRVQEQALSYFMNNIIPGDIIPAKVTHLEPFGAFVDIGCGITSLIGIENISISRISHPKDRFQVGDNIYAIVTKTDKENKRIFLSHRELLGTWIENATKFSVGQTVRGIVRGIEDYGIFIELAPNLSGLAEYCDNLSPGDSVSVYIKNILPEKMKTKLVIIDVLNEKHKNLIKPQSYFITKGNIKKWNYSPYECCNKVISSYF